MTNRQRPLGGTISRVGSPGSDGSLVTDGRLAVTVTAGPSRDKASSKRRVTRPHEETRIGGAQGARTVRGRARDPLAVGAPFQLRSEGSESSRQAFGLDPLLYHLVAFSANQVSTFASDLGHCFDEVGASVEEADPVVRGVAVGQHAIGDQLLEQWAALGFRVVVNSIGVGD